MAETPRFRKDAVAVPEEKHPVDETLPPLKMFTSGLQHVAAMYAGVVAPPMIVGPAVGLSATETAFLMGASSSPASPPSSRPSGSGRSAPNSPSSTASPSPV